MNQVLEEEDMYRTQGVTDVTLPSFVLALLLVLALVFPLPRPLGRALCRGRRIIHAYRRALLLLGCAGVLHLRYESGSCPGTSFLEDLQRFITEETSLLSHRMWSMGIDVLVMGLGVQLLRCVSALWAAPFQWSLRDVWSAVYDQAFAMVSMLPPVQRIIQREMGKIERDVEHALKGDKQQHRDPHGQGEDDKRKGEEETEGTLEGRFTRLPASPAGSSTSIISMIQKRAKKEDASWQGGKASGAVYHGGEEHTALMNQAYAAFSVSNPLHPDLWPSCMKFEAEIVSMTARLLDGGQESVVGSLSSGGTESIVLAAKTHRDYYRARGITQPEIVACVSAHAGIDKACSLLSIKLVKVPMDAETFKADTVAMQRAMTVNTIMLYASAPSFPQGIIDPIQELSQMAQRHGCGLHVDCCLGGFVLPFARKLGLTDIPAFDFSLPGVTSMSVDTHKYGYASKGTSVVLYRDKQLRHCQYFCYPDWTGGLYCTPTIAGSRPGGLVAAAWAAMVSMGEEGYLAVTEGILQAVRVIVDGIEREIPELRVLGKPQAMVVCFGSSDRGGGGSSGGSSSSSSSSGTRQGCNVYSVSDGMSRRGWSLNSLQSPPCVHICVTRQTVGQEHRFVRDLREAVAETRGEEQEQPTEGEIEGKKTKKKKSDGGDARIYGMAGGMPAGPVKMLLQAYTDITLQA